MNLRDWSIKYLCMYMDLQLRALRRSGKSDDQSDLCLAKFTALAPYLQVPRNQHFSRDHRVPTLFLGKRHDVSSIGE